jgi:hypothetical protein
MPSSLLWLICRGWLTYVTCAALVDDIGGSHQTKCFCRDRSQICAPKLFDAGARCRCRDSNLNRFGLQPSFI